MPPAMPDSNPSTVWPRSTTSFEDVELSSTELHSAVDDPPLYEPSRSTLAEGQEILADPEPANPSATGVAADPDEKPAAMRSAVTLTRTASRPSGRGLRSRPSLPEPPSAGLRSRASLAEPPAADLAPQPSASAEPRRSLEGSHARGFQLQRRPSGASSVAPPPGAGAGADAGNPGLVARLRGVVMASLEDLETLEGEGPAGYEPQYSQRPSLAAGPPLSRAMSVDRRPGSRWWGPHPNGPANPSFLAAAPGGGGALDLLARYGAYSQSDTSMLGIRAFDRASWHGETAGEFPGEDDDADDDDSESEGVERRAGGPGAGAEDEESQRMAEKRREKKQRRVMGLVIGGSPRLPSRSASLPENTQAGAEAVAEAGAEEEKLGGPRGAAAAAVALPLPPAEVETPKRGFFYAVWMTTTPVERVLMLIACVAACAAGLTRPLTSLVLGSFTNAFTAYGAVKTDDTRTELLHRGNVLALDVIYIGIGAFATSALWTIIFESIANRVAYRLRALVFSSALDQELSFHEKRSAAEILSVVQADVQLVKDALGEKTGALLVYLATFLSGFAIALLKSWHLGLLLGCTVLPTILLAGFLVQRQSAKFARKAFAVYAAASSLTDEAISSIRTVYAFNAQQQLADKYEAKLARSLGYATRKALFQGALIGSAVFIIFSAYALCFYYGTTLLLEGDATPGSVVSVFFAILVSCLGLTSAAPVLEAFARASAGCAKIYRIIEREPLLDRTGDYTNPELAGRIELDAIEFAYPSRPTTVILKRVSVTIEAGQKTALVGGSGSGKSTIIQLLLRFYQPGRGGITLDGTPLDRYDLDWLRMNIGYVPQDPELFSISVLDNVAMGLPPLLAAELQPAEVQELVVAACKKAQIHEAIMRLPEGYFTFIGERGSQFSGGQRARLSIARAIISDPPILLFDEPTSALDAINESMVQETLDRVCAGKTTITVAHRLSTIRNSDKIIVMREGVPIEEGDHAQLMARQGEYSKLVAAQQLAKAAEAAGQVAQSTAPVGSAIAASTSGPSGDWQSLADRRGSISSSRKLLMPVEHRPEKPQKRSKARPVGPSTWALFKSISRLAQGLRRLFLISFCCTLVSGCLYPVLAIVLGLTVGAYEKSLLSGQASALRTDGNQYSLYFFILALVGLIFLTAEWFGFGVMSQQLAVRIRAAAFRSILQLPIAYFDEDANSTAALVTFINSTAQSITNLTGTTFGAILESAVTLAVGAAVALVYGWKLAVVTVSTIPFVLVLGLVRVLIVARRERLSRQPATDALVVVGETLTGIRITSAFPLVEETMRKAFNDKLAEPYRYAIKYARVEALSYGVTQMCLIWIIALTFWYGSRLIAQGFFSTGGFYTVFISVIFGAMHAGTMLIHAGDISKARSSAAQLVDLMDKADKERSLGLPVLRAPIHGDIRARGVTFAYPGRPNHNVFQNLTLEIRAGQYVAFVGESGSGKSTITQLLYRFYEANSGAIMIDDTKISGWDVASYRSHMAYVPQMPTLYDGTIRWNIELGLQGKTCTEAEMEKVCADAGLSSFVSSLPEGLDTPLGQKGLALSGGQRQRIAIARAIISKPRILILDEATAALDSSSERAVQAALDKAAEGRTTIAIAHRLATVQKADRIFVLAGGKIVDQGTHDQLMRKPGSYYASLAARQSLE